MEPARKLQRSRAVKSEAASPVRLVPAPAVLNPPAGPLSGGASSGARVHRRHRHHPWNQQEESDPPERIEPTRSRIRSPSLCADTPGVSNVVLCCRCGQVGHSTESCPLAPRPSEWRTYPEPDPLTAVQRSAVMCLIEEEQRQMVRAISVAVTEQLEIFRQQIDLHRRADDADARRWRGD